MTYKIFLLEDRIPFLLDQMSKGKVVVGEKDDTGMIPVDITIDNSYDLLGVFHAGTRAGEKPYLKINLV
jgi:hypothetical protein